MSNEPFADLIGANILIHQPSTAGRFRYECIRCAVIGKAGRMAAVEFESYRGVCWLCATGAERRASVRLPRAVQVKQQLDQFREDK